MIENAHGRDETERARTASHQLKRRGALAGLAALVGAALAKLTTRPAEATVGGTDGTALIIAPTTPNTSTGPTELAGTGGPLLRLTQNNPRTQALIANGGSGPNINAIETVFGAGGRANVGAAPGTTGGIGVLGRGGEGVDSGTNGGDRRLGAGWDRQPAARRAGRGRRAGNLKPQRRRDRQGDGGRQSESGHHRLGHQRLRRVRLFAKQQRDRRPERRRGGRLRRLRRGAGGYGIYGGIAVQGGYAGGFAGPVLVVGDFTATGGAKSAVVPHPDGTHRELP